MICLEQYLTNWHFHQLTMELKKQARPGPVVPLKGNVNILSLGIALIEPLSTIFKIFPFKKLTITFATPSIWTKFAPWNLHGFFWMLSPRVINRSWSCLNITGSKTWPVDNGPWTVGAWNSLAEFPEKPWVYRILKLASDLATSGFICVSESCSHDG